MPSIDKQFSVRVDSRVVETLLSDFSKVYYLFPAFASSEKTETGYRWNMKTPVELEAGTPCLLARILKQDPGLIEWEAVSPTLIWRGAFAWLTKGDCTEITLRLDIRDEGIGGAMHEALLKVELPDLARFFATRTREILESKPWLNGLP
jgi:hypothetical protein